MAYMKEILRQLRESKRYSQSEMAMIVGLSKSAISMYERGERTPDNETLAKYANHFGVDYNYLHGYDVPMHEATAKEKSPLESELSEEIVIYHRDGKNVVKKFSPEQIKAIHAFLEAMPGETENEEPKS